MRVRTLQPTEVDHYREWLEYGFYQEPSPWDLWFRDRFKEAEGRGVFDDTGQMLAAMTLRSFRMWIDGRQLQAGAVSAVVSPPEHRRQGAVATMLVSSLREMYENGQSLSVTYPFSFQFYRRYGWELAGKRVIMTVRPEHLPTFRKLPGSVQRLDPNVGWRKLDCIYKKAAMRARGWLCREDAHFWRVWAFEEIGQNHDIHSALWYPPGSSEAEGYIVFWFEGNSRETRRLMVKEWVCLTGQAAQGLLGFIAQHDSHVTEAVIRLDPSWPVEIMLDMQEQVRLEMVPRWSLRLVDLPGAFDARSYPETTEGRVTIAVHDEHCPWNQGTWNLEWGGGAARVSPSRASAQLSADVRTWSQIYSGYISPFVARDLGRLEVTDVQGLTLLTTALSGAPFHLWELF